LSVLVESRRALAERPAERTESRFCAAERQVYRLL